MLDRLTEIRNEITALLQEGFSLTDECILELSHELDRIILGLIPKQNHSGGNSNDMDNSQAG